MMKGTLISFGFWNVVNLIVMNLRLPDSHLKREDYLDMRNRMVSFVHGFISLVGAGYHTYFLHTECGQPNSDLEHFLCLNSFGYFLYDFFIMIYFGIMDSGTFLHHIICMIGMGLSIYDGVAGNYVVLGIYVAEISNPIMHIRMVIKHLGLRFTKAYEFCELSYILLFIYGRIILGTPVMIKTVTCSTNNYVVRFAGVALAL